MPNPRSNLILVTSSTQFSYSVTVKILCRKGISSLCSDPSPNNFQQARLNRFCQLSKTLPSRQFLADIIMLDGQLHESAHPFYIAFQVLKVLLIIFFIIHSPGILVLIVLHQSLHQQMSYFATFQNFIQHYLKQDFFINVSFINGFTHPPPAIPTPILLMTKICKA